MESIQSNLNIGRVGRRHTLLHLSFISIRGKRAPSITEDRSHFRDLSVQLCTFRLFTAQFAIIVLVVIGMQSASIRMKETQPGLHLDISNGVAKKMYEQ